jgi:hypothetical protein
MRQPEKYLSRSTPLHIYRKRQRELRSVESYVAVEGVPSRRNIAITSVNGPGGNARRAYICLACIGPQNLSRSVNY